MTVFLSSKYADPDHQISTAPAGRGRRQRASVAINPAYIRSLLERSMITQRDERVLRDVNELGAMSVGQLARLHWQNLSTARHRLRKLYDLHLLDRSEYNPAKMTKSGLTPGVIYTLGKAGRLWLNLRTGQKERYVVQPLHSLYHNLALAESIVVLTEAARSTQQWILGWQGERSCRVRHLKGDKPVVVLEPDGLLAFRQHEQPPARFYYLEMDLGTESRAVFAKKIRRYEKYYRRDEWRERYNWEKFPSVLVVTNTTSRAEGLLETIQQARLPISWGVCTLEDLVTEDRSALLWAEIWQVAQPGQQSRRQALLRR